MVLRILLELSPGYNYEAKLMRSDRFSYALANLDREEFWEGFSALSEFRARQRQQGSPFRVYRFTGWPNRAG